MVYHGTSVNKGKRTRERSQALRGQDSPNRLSSGEDADRKGEYILKKLILLITAVAVTLSLTAFAGAEYDPSVNYMKVMLAAAASGDTKTGMEAAEARNEKIEDMDLSCEYDFVDFNDLYLLAKIIYAEAGSSWLSDEWKMCVGEVVLNRVASPEFPNTIEEVIYQRGQYYSRGSRYFASLKPSSRCVAIALRLLTGERYINDPRVVFQANFRQGSGVALHFRDRYLGSTYFCYSSHPGLYAKEIEVSA